MAKTNPVLEHIVQKFKSDHQLLSEVKRSLQTISSSIFLKAQISTTFCHRFNLTLGIANKLLKSYGITDDQMKNIMKELGFHTNRMYEDPYYQSLLILYYIGVRLNDDQLRSIALFFILIKLYNGMQYKYFQAVCNENIAAYVMRNMRGSAIFKKYQSPIDVVSYFINTLDNTYKDRIKRDPMELIKVFTQAWNRLNQMFRNIAQYYYKAHGEGKSDIKLTDIALDDNQSAIGSNLPESVVHLLVDKFNKAYLIKPIKLPESEKQYLSQYLTITKNAIERVESYIDDSHHQERVNNQLVYLLNALKIKNEKDIDGVPIIHTIDKLMGKRGDINIQRLKESVDDSLNQIFGLNTFKFMSRTQQLKLRKMYMMILFYKFKAVVSKTSKFERVAV